LWPHPKGADGDEGIGRGSRLGGEHLGAWCGGYGVRKRQVVKSIVVNVIVYLDFSRVVVARGTDIEQRCCPAFGLQRFAHQAQ